MWVEGGRRRGQWARRNMHGRADVLQRPDKKRTRVRDMYVQWKYCNEVHRPMAHLFVDGVCLIRQPLDPERLCGLEKALKSLLSDVDFSSVNVSDEAVDVDEVGVPEDHHWMLTRVVL